ncbi:MAG: hypothetical protein AB7G12_00770 [Thermoanaerobaculia bacterium]
MQLHRRRKCLGAGIALFLAGAGYAAAIDSPFDLSRYGLVWREPGADRVQVRKGIAFAGPGGRDLSFDLALPADRNGRGGLPAVVIASRADRASGSPVKDWASRQDWMRTFAARGLAGISLECDPRDVAGSLVRFVEFLASKSTELGVDSSNLAFLATSDEVAGLLQFAAAGDEAGGPRALALLYGAADEAALRDDLPTLLVVAGKDAEAAVAAESRLADRAAAARGPWTVVRAPGLAPGFDALDTGMESRAVVGQVIRFLESRLGLLPAGPDESAEQKQIREALLDLQARRFEAAHEILNEIAEQHQGDVHLWLAIAEARRGMRSPFGEFVALEQAILADPADLRIRRRYGRLAASLNVWEELANVLQPVVEAGEADAVDFGLIGLSYLQLDRPQDAIAPLERAVALGAEPATRYNLACALAKSGDPERAISVLVDSVDAGFADVKLLREDHDLDGLRSDDRFRALLGRFEEPAAVP